MKTSVVEGAKRDDETVVADLTGAYALNKQHGMLSEDEVAYAVSAAKLRHSDKKLQFIEVNFLEPSKAELKQSLFSRRPLIRKAEVITISLELNQTLVDIIVVNPPSRYEDDNIRDVGADPIGCSNEITVIVPNAQPGLSPDEYAFVEILCKSYDPLLDAIAARGLDREGLRADAWCVGHTGPDCDPVERVCWPSLFYCGCSEDEAGDLIYARPIEGIEMRISLTHRKVIRFEDNSVGVFPIPGSREGVDTKYVTPEFQRKDLKPLVINQPEGPSWTVTHVNTVEWQNWNFQVGFNSREGATLHGITYNGRPILHKMSFCEMVVPYGDPRPPHSMKNAFDAGEDGFGRNANSLVLGCDCLGIIHYFDANLVDDSGDPYLIKNSVCMHEEDAGMGWKHTDWRTGHSEVRRSRRLVVSFVCTIANYDYGFAYHLYLDGTIEGNVKLTGALSTGATSKEDQALGYRKYGTSLGGCLYAPVHQHFFVARMDFCVDGERNSVVEYNARPETEGPHNPTLNGFYFEETALESELSAVRDLSPETARFWKVISSDTYNSTGKLTGYKIMPAPKCLPFAPLARAAHLKRALFLEHQMWVTAFNAAEKYPGGDFPNQNPIVDGLPVWTQRNAPLKNADLVVWHVFGMTHLPRLEDWPIMPTEHISFHLKPSGFFDSSPAMDVPPGNGSHCRGSDTDSEAVLGVAGGSACDCSADASGNSLNSSRDVLQY